MNITKNKLATFILTLFMSYFVLFGLNPEPHYNGEIEHLTFTTLMAFPDKALSPKNNQSKHYDETKITPIEFKNILDQLYENDYILIKISDTFFIENNVVHKKKLCLPKNKKPLLLSFDNVTYKSSYQNSGNVDKIIIDRNNNFATYTTKKSIQDRVMYDNEFIPILENFIFEHPDFSYNSARGIIFLTGENGVLGYKTNSKNASAKIESKKVLEVVNKLKISGWEFGCNNYRYKDINNTADIEFIKDLSLWQKEIKPIIDNTPLFAFPQGINCIDKTKIQILLDNNFKAFFYNSMDKTFLIENNTLTMSRKPVNGITLRNNRNNFKNLFSCQEVYDNINRTIPFEPITT